jgi:NhaP-type Na+/H+ or K+/H+ antiporter
LFGYDSKITLKELVFISYAGLIRGAVAFALVLQISDDVPNRPVIVTTSLSLVVFTTVIMGSTVSTLSKLLFKKENQDR